MHCVAVAQPIKMPFGTGLDFHHCHVVFVGGHHVSGKGVSCHVVLVRGLCRLVYEFKYCELETFLLNFNL